MATMTAATLTADLNCPCCGSDRCVSLGRLPERRWFAGRKSPESLPGGSLFRCETCALRFRAPLLPPARYLDLYDNGATDTWVTQRRREDWVMITRFLATAFARGANILDFGCNTGGLLAQLDPTHRRYGIELNSAAAQVARAKAGATVWSGLGDIPSNLKFDAVLLVDVIEHVANPAALIDALTPLLTDQGILVITTGDAEYDRWARFGANWWYCAYPEHIAFISAHWLSYWAPRLALRVVRRKNFSYVETSARKRWLESFFAGCYGRFPTSYIAMMAFLLRLLGSRREVPIPGAGAGPDHLFIVLAKE